MTDREIDDIEARAERQERFDPKEFEQPHYECHDRGHAPACFACQAAAYRARREARGPTFASEGRRDVLRLVKELRRMRSPAGLREYAIERRDALVDDAPDASSDWEDMELAMDRIIARNEAGSTTPR